MGNAEIKKILEYVEDLFAIHDRKCKETEKKMYANEEMPIEDRIQYATTFCEYNAVCIVLKNIISLIKDSFETEKFWEEKKKEEHLKTDIECTIKDCFFGKGYLCDECYHNKKSQEQTQPNLDEKDIMRKTILKQLKGLLNQNQADAITNLEFGLGNRGIKDKEIYQIFKYRLEGVILVISNTEYEPEKSRKITKIISKLYENKIL